MMIYGKLDIKDINQSLKNYFNTLRTRSNVVVILDEREIENELYSRFYPTNLYKIRTRFNMK